MTLASVSLGTCLTLLRQLALRVPRHASRARLPHSARPDSVGPNMLSPPPEPASVRLTIILMRKQRFLLLFVGNALFIVTPTSDNNVLFVFLVFLACDPNCKSCSKVNMCDAGQCNSGFVLDTSSSTCKGSLCFDFFIICTAQ